METTVGLAALNRILSELGLGPRVRQKILRVDEVTRLDSWRVSISD